MRDYTFKVEKGIEIPGIRRQGRKNVLGTFLKSLKPGDSFLLPKGMDKSTISISARRAGVKLTRRKMGKQYRFWMLGRKYNKRK